MKETKKIGKKEKRKKNKREKKEKNTQNTLNSEIVLSNIQMYVKSVIPPRLILG